MRYELNVYTINDNIVEYREKWKQNITRMGKDTIPKNILNCYCYNLRGRRRLRGTKKMMVVNTL